VRRSEAFALLALIAILAGCDASTKGSGAPADSSSGASRTSAPPGSFGSTAPPPHAADGTKVAACADGRCEVLVKAGTAIPVPKSMNVEKVTVSALSRSRVTITGHDVGNASGGGCTGQCDSSSTNGNFKIALGAGSQATENGLALTVEQIAGDSAVIQVAPAG